MSYIEHFQFNEPPFRLTPDPQFVYWSKQHSRAKAFMESTIWLADGFVVITGEIGSGKTTLLRTFLSEMGDDVVYAVVSQTQLTPKQFLQSVLAEFGFKPFNKSKVELLDMFNMFLVEQYGNGKKILLIVDEAQNLGKNVLEEIRLLSGIETEKEKILRIILAGQPELKGTLESKSLKQLVQRVRLQFHIGPLDEVETREYVAHRVEVAGRKDHEIFDEGAHEPIYRYSGGVPRLINTLCDTAMLCAFAEEKTIIDSSDIAAAAEELNWTELEYTTGQYRQKPRLVHAEPRTGNLTKIELRHGGEVVTEHTFGAGRAIAGRAPNNEIYIKSKYVSRHHAQLTSDDSGCFLEDLNSTNGLYVGDKRIKRRQLRDGDVISLGEHELVYTDLREAQTQSSRAVGGKNKG